MKLLNGAWVAGVSLAFSTVLWSAPGADLLRGPIRGGFSVAEADRETGARKYALWGESATPLSADRWEIESPRLELYGEAESTNLVFAPDRCVFDRVEQRIVSTAPLRVWSGDGYLQMEGEGFSLDLEARQLWVSNRVSAVMSKRLFARQTGFGTGSVNVGSMAEGADVIRIQSNRLEYGNDRAEFRDAVRAEDAEGRVECRALSVDLAPGAPDVRALRAAGEVRFTAGDLTVESEAADYDPLAGRLELTGNPRWVYRERPGYAQRIVLYRDQRKGSATGGTRMELPPGSMVLPAVSPGGVAVGSGAEPAAEPVTIAAQTLELEPLDDASEQQLVLLKGEVSVQQGESRMRSDELRVIVHGTRHSLERAKATGNVHMVRGADRMK